MSLINQLHPNIIWTYFDEICQVPRPSKKEELIIEYLVQFAKDFNLEVDKDQVGNVLIKKQAYSGFENAPIVVLQSHMDMVGEKNSEVIHDFEIDAIQPYVDGDWVKAKGTTLGSDDGIGMAAQLALLASSDIVHGPLECLFTVDEETGLTGAYHLQEGFLKGKTLINLDSEDEGELYVGCAGGIDTVATFDYQKKALNERSYAFKVTVTGLKGGHSGDDIHKGLGNANKILNRYLYQIMNDYGMQISHVNGGNLRNAIPREASAVAVVPNQYKEQARVALNLFFHDVQMELQSTEPDLRMKLESVDLPDFVIDTETQKQLINAVYACPHGVMRMSQEIEGLVETSTNLASIKMTDHSIVVTTSQRSSVESAKEDIANMVASVFFLAGANVEHSDGYPGWTPNLDSRILKISQKAYVNLFDQEPKVKAIHAGLECGLFLEKYPDLDMVSFGPTIKGAHSPDERLDIKSVKKFWDHLIEVLKNTTED